MLHFLYLLLFEKIKHSRIFFILKEEATAGRGLVSISTSIKNLDFDLVTQQ